MKKNKGFSAFNLGNSLGFSVLDVIRACEAVIGKSLSYEVCSQRVGDPAMLVAESSRALSFLSWVPANTDLTSIVESAHHWHRLQNE